MSNRCSAAVYERYPYGGSEFALALALADNAHEDGSHIFPSVETMALKSRQSVRSVQRNLRKMVAIGWLELVRNGRGGRGLSAEYRISAAWLKGGDLAPFMETPEEVQKGDKQGIERVPNATQKGDKRDSAYITLRTTIEPNTPLPPVGGEREDAQSAVGTGTVAGSQGGEVVRKKAGSASGFEQLWSAYPKKVAHGKALQAFTELAPDDALQAVMLAAVVQWVKSTEWGKDGGRWVPKLDRWLREERWLDVPGFTAPGSAQARTSEPVAVAAPMPAEQRAKIAALLGSRAGRHAHLQAGA